MRSKIAVGVVALAVAFGILAVAVPAQASLSECPSGWVCLYDNAGFVNRFWTTFGVAGQCINAPSYANDRADSFYVHLDNGGGVRFYQDANCGGHELDKAYTDSCAPGIFWDGTSGNYCNRQIAHGYHVDINKLTSIRYY